MMFIFNIFFKEWIRTGGIRKIIQIIISFILPITFYVLFSVLPAMIKGDQSISYFSAGFLIYLITAVYAIYYIVESEAKIFIDFPIDYIPLKKSFLYIVNIIFITVLSIIIIYISMFITLFLFSRFTINSMHIFSFNKIIKFLSTLLYGLPYMVLTGILTGFFLGIIGKKIADNFNENSRQIFLKIYFIVLFFALKGYFQKLFLIIKNNDFSNKFFIFSPVYFASIFSHLFNKHYNFLHIGYSIVFNIVIFSIFIFLADRKFKLKFLPSVDFSFNKKSISQISPVWNIMIKRFFSLFMIIFLIIWFIIMLINKFLFNSIFVQGILVNPGLMLFVFLFIDKIIPKKHEDYKLLWEGFPVSSRYITSVFLGTYYIFFIIPIYLYSKLSISQLVNFSKPIEYPMTLSGVLLQIFPYITFTIIIPMIIYMYPILWSSNKKNKKISKRDTLILMFFMYIVFSSIIAIATGYMFSEQFRQFINNQIFGYGYYIGKTVFYLIILSAIFLHIKSLYLSVLSFVYKR